MLEEIVRALNQVGFVPCFGLLCRGIGGVQMSSVCAVICYKLESWLCSAMLPSVVEASTDQNI